MVLWVWRAVCRYVVATLMQYLIIVTTKQETDTMISSLHSLYGKQTHTTNMKFYSLMPLAPASGFLATGLIFFSAGAADELFVFLPPPSWEKNIHTIPIDHRHIENNTNSFIVILHFCYTPTNLDRLVQSTKETKHKYHHTINKTFNK